MTIEATADTVGKQPLSRGAGWLQFVIFSSGGRAAAGDPQAGGQWVTVRGNA